MRILHVCTHYWFKYGQKPHMQDRKISHGLVRAGHYVYDFSYRDVASYSSLLRKRKFGRNKMNDALALAVERLEPDLLLLGHTEMVDSKTLSLIRKQYPNIKIAMWFVDALYKKPMYQEKLPYLDAFFATGAGEPLDGLTSSTGGGVYFFPNVCDPSLDIFSAYAQEKSSYDLTFIGTNKGGERADFVTSMKRELSDFNLGLFGFSKDTKKVSFDYVRLLGDSAMGLNYSCHNDQPLYTSDRQVHMAANGVMVFMPDVPGFKDLFSEEEQVYFSSYEDFIEKARYYRDNEDERRQIAERGQSRAHRSYNAERVCRFMVEAIQSGNFSEPYEWLSYCPSIGR